MTTRMAGLSALLLCTLLASAAAPTAAQDPAPAPPDPTADATSSTTGHRRFLLSGLGLLVGLVPALLTTEGLTEQGFCSSRTCTAGLGAMMGASVGFLIGRDLDRSAAAREARGPTLRFPAQPIELDLLPQTVDAYEGGAIVVGREGIAMIGRDHAVRRRGGSIRGVSAVAALPAHDAMLAATATGIYSFDLHGSRAEGRIVLRDGGATLQPIATDQIVLGGSDLVRRLRLSGRGSLLELAEEARADAQGLSTALVFAPRAGIIWALSRDRIVARTTQLREVGSVVLPAIGRSLSVSGRRALVAAGTEGLFVVDIAEPAAPRVLGQVRGIGFAFDAVLEGDTAYVAGGRTGLLVVDVTNPAAPRVLGVARDLGFVSSVALAPDGQIYVADREGQRLFLVQPKTSGPASMGGR